MNRSLSAMTAAALALGLTSTAMAKPPLQGGGSAGGPTLRNGIAPQGSATSAPPPGEAAGGSASGGTAGSTTAGDTAASSLGLGATTTGPAGTASALGTGGSAVTGEGGHVNDRSRVHQTGHGLMGNARAQAMDHGTFSKSRTKTRVVDGQNVTGTTRTMSHVPGSKPVKSTTSINEPVPPGQ